MKKSLFALALTALVASTASAQANTDPDVNAAQGKDPIPAGWEMRLDRPTANKSALRFVEMGKGLHVTSGPAAIYWNSANAVTGDFAAEATFSQTKKPTHPEAFGITWGGKNLADATLEYYYFIVRGDGKFMVKHRAGAELHELAGWTDFEGVSKENAAGAATTTLKVEVTASATKLYANGKLAYTINDGSANGGSNGVVGLRVNHNLDVHVGNFAVKK